MPANTIGFAGWKPGSAASHGRFNSVIVSPTRASATSRIAAVKKPTSPGPSSPISRANGAKTPRFWISYSRAAAMNSTFCFGRSMPSTTRTRMTTPR